jgi:ABC-type uncharacterized transport system substrate-binding protein
LHLAQTRKALELLKKIIPKTNRVLMIVDPNNQGMKLRLKAIQTAAAKLAIDIQPIHALGETN